MTQLRTSISALQPTNIATPGSTCTPQRLELRLGVRIVIRAPRPRMRPANTEIDHQLRHRLRGHRATPVSMGRVRNNPVAGDGVGEEVFRHDRVLDGRDQPPGRVAGDDVEHPIQLVPLCSAGAFQRRDVPGPRLAQGRARPTQDGPAVGGWPGRGVPGSARQPGRSGTCSTASTRTGPRRAHGPRPAGSPGPGRPRSSAARAPRRARRRSACRAGAGVPGAGRPAARPHPGRVGTTVVRGPGPAGQRARPRNRHLGRPQLARTRSSVLLPRRRWCLVVRALGQLLQERVCFSMMSNAARVFSRSASSFALRARSG